MQWLCPFHGDDKRHPGTEGDGAEPFESVSYLKGKDQKRMTTGCGSEEWAPEE